MTKKREMAKLKEIGRVYQNPAERVAAYKRHRVILLAIAWCLIFMATLLGKLHAVSDLVCLGMAVIGGGALGLPVWFSVAANQVPLWVRYTALREEEIRKRLEELKGA